MPTSKKRSKSAPPKAPGTDRNWEDDVSTELRGVVRALNNVLGKKKHVFKRNNGAMSEFMALQNQVRSSDDRAQYPNQVADARALLPLIKNFKENCIRGLAVEAEGIINGHWSAMMGALVKYVLVQGTPTHTSVVLVKPTTEK